jgi:hypothetical protein
LANSPSDEPVEKIGLEIEEKEGAIISLSIQVTKSLISCKFREGGSFLQFS